MCCGDLHVNIFTFCAQEKAGASPGGHQRRQRRVQVVIRGGKGESRWSSEEAGAWAPKAGGRGEASPGSKFRGRLPPANVGYFSRLFYQDLLSKSYIGPSAK